MRYYVAFDTNEMKPHVVATCVELKKEVIRDMERKLPVNLSDDPNYGALWKYCRDNPPRELP